MLKGKGQMVGKIAASMLVVSMAAACASRAPTIPPPLGPVVAPETPRAPPTPPAPVGPIPGSAEDFRVTVNERVFFALDRYDLDPESRATLERQAAWLRTYQSVRVLIEGNADERGTREYNLGLGERRGNAVRDLLLAKGARSEQLTVVSYGEERPVCAESTDDCWARNRRADLVYTQRQ